MKNCYEAGCPFADKDTGSCNDKSCLAHPENIESANRKDARYFASLQIVEAVIWFQVNVCKRGLKLIKSPQPLFDLYSDVLIFPSKEAKKELEI